MGREFEKTRDKTFSLAKSHKNDKIRHAKKQSKISKIIDKNCKKVDLGTDHILLCLPGA